MKKIYFIMISIMLVLSLAVGCTGPQNTEPPIHGDNTGDEVGGGTVDHITIDYPTFNDYNEYLEYIETKNYPDNFIHAKEFLSLGTFKRAILWDTFGLVGYIYAYTDENDNEIVLTFNVLPEDSPTDITKYLMEEYEERNTQNQRFVECSADLFVNNNLLQCYNKDIWVTDVRIGDMDYHYWGGNLGCIYFIRNGLLCNISWYNKYNKSENADKTVFSDLFVTNMLFVQVNKFIV